MRAACGSCPDVEADYLWQRIVADDPAIGTGLARLRARRPGSQARPGRSCTRGARAARAGARGAARAAAPAGSDVDAFARWAERYQRELAHAGRDRPRARWRMSSSRAAPA